MRWNAMMEKPPNPAISPPQFLFSFNSPFSPLASHCLWLFMLKRLLCAALCWEAGHILLSPYVSCRFSSPSLSFPWLLLANYNQIINAHTQACAYLLFKATGNLRSELSPVLGGFTFRNPSEGVVASTWQNTLVEQLCLFSHFWKVHN